MIRHLESACLQEHGTIEEYIQTAARQANESTGSLCALFGIHKLKK